MNMNEIRQAAEMLDGYMGDTNRDDTAVEGDGFCLTAHWRDGGQTRFLTFEAVEEWLAGQRRRDETESTISTDRQAE